MSARIRPFVIDLAEEVLADLTQRVRATRWPPPAPDVPWRQGTDLADLQELVGYWANGFDWRAREHLLNGFAHRQVELDGVWIHFIHERAADGAGIPLVLTHGWPSSFLEYLPLVPLLTDPASHGISGRSFDLVIPSLPGYAFSERPLRSGVTSRDVAGMWHQLMGTLGYDRYGAGGGDFGSAVSTYLALEHPGSVIGQHLSNLDVTPYSGPGSPPLTDDERAFEGAWAAWTLTEGGYK